jgi:hypothetical protein
MINIYCKCGEIYHADEQHIGKKIICSRCGQIIVIKLQDNVSSNSIKKSENDSYSYKSSTLRKKSIGFFSNKFIKGLFNKSWKLISGIILLIISIIIISNLKFNKESFDQENTVTNNQRENNYDNVQTPLSEDYDMEPFRPFKPIRAMDYICIVPIKEPMETDIEFQKRIDKYKFYKSENKKNAIAFNNSYEKYKIDSTAWAIGHKKWRDKHPNWKSITRYDDLKLNYSTTSDKYPTSTNNEPKPYPFPVLPNPRHGELKINFKDKRIAPFEINTEVGGNYLIKLQNTTNTNKFITIFIHGGRTTNASIPLGEYILKYAFGYKWYGYEHLFGEETAYSKADDVFEFTQDMKWTVTLYAVVGGNLSTSDINPEEF